MMHQRISSTPPYFAAALALLLLLGTGLRLSHLGDVPSRSPDERIYTERAHLLLERGGGALRELAEKYFREPDLRLYPLPTRVGYQWLLAGTMQLAGVTDARAGAFISCAASIGSLLVAALIGVRFFPPWATLAALLFFAISPAELSLARRAWVDAPLGFTSLLMIWAAAEISVDSGRRAWHVLFVASCCAALTIKETGPLVAGICLVWISWVVVERRAWRDWSSLVLLWCAGMALTVSWLAFSVGGYGVYVRILASLQGANAGNAYAIEYATGPWYRVVQSLLIVAPLPAICCFVGFFPAIVPPRSGAAATSRRAIAGIAFVLVVFLALPMIVPHWVNLRYLSAVFGPLCLVAGLGFWYAFSELAGRVPAAGQRAVAVVAGIVLLTGAAADYRYYRDVIVGQDLPDLALKTLLDARRQGRQPAPAAGPQRALSAEDFVNLSLSYHREGRYREAIAACNDALRLKPDFAEAYNNLAAAYESLALWDEAILAAEQAVRLKPDFTLARNNLRYSREQKNRQAGLPAAKQ